MPIVQQKKADTNIFLKRIFSLTKILLMGEKAVHMMATPHGEAIGMTQITAERELFVVNDLDGELQFDFIISN